MRNLTEIVFILDASGSMSGVVNDTIGGFNAMLERQKKEAEGEAYLSTVIFDTATTVLHDRIDINKVEPLTDREYVIGGCTALLDAVGGAIHHIGNIHKYARPEDRPTKTLFIITTDGEENASTRYDYRHVKKMIKRQEEKYGWEFLFLGANIDAAEAAESIGIKKSRAVQYKQDAMGVGIAFEAVADTACYMRTVDACMASMEEKELAVGARMAKVRNDVRRRGR